MVFRKGVEPTFLFVCEVSRLEHAISAEFREHICFLLYLKEKEGELGCVSSEVIVFRSFHFYSGSAVQFYFSPPTMLSV